ncbi:MAG: BON domain-containing protein [Betaproteobacteria bacterium]|nr:BON domain-containing protein [Betaproteobacteria bacterium]
MKPFSDPIRPQAILGVLFSGAALFLVSACDNRQPDTSAGAPASTSVGTTVGTTIDDGIVTTKVKSALLADPDVKSLDLKVETRQGEVMLSGFVDNIAHVERAILVARGVPGVKSVTNKMDLKQGAASVGNTVDDGIMTAKIKSALLADPNIKSFDIAVVTRKGEAQLSGFVNSQAQIDHASELARAVAGVKSVANEMSVKK